MLLSGTGEGEELARRFAADMVLADLVVYAISRLRMYFKIDNAGVIDVHNCLPNVKENFSGRDEGVAYIGGRARLHREELFW